MVQKNYMIFLVQSKYLSSGKQTVHLVKIMNKIEINPKIFKTGETASI